MGKSGEATAKASWRAGLWMRVFDADYMKHHIFINVVSVIVINSVFEKSLCVDQLLACCDPFNEPWPMGHFGLGGIPVNFWLMGHFVAYAQASCIYAGGDTIKQFNVALGQVVWFTFELFTFYHTYEYEQYKYYGEVGSGLPGVHNGRKHPCGEVPYPSTWLPIWEDFIYNTAGQLAGLAFYVLFLKANNRGSKNA